jgi:hypothetical protein
MEIVFKLAQSQEDLRIHVKSTNLPFYTGQEVSIVKVGNNIVALVDLATKNYCYTAENYGVKLGLGIAIYWVLIVGALGGFFVYYFQREQSIVEILTPLACAWLVYTIQKCIFHLRVQKELDKFLDQ